MTEQQTKIQNRIRQMKEQKAANALYVPAKPETKGWKWGGFVSAFLGSCIVLLTIATIGLMANKHAEQQIAQAQPSPIIVQPEAMVDTSRFITSDDTGNFLTTSEGEKMVSSVQERLDKLEGTIDNMQHRQWLLSLAVNENANIARRYHNAGYITFNGDWKLSHMPTTMKLDEETKAKLREADLAIEAATGVKSECSNHHYVMEADDMHYHCTNCNARYARQSGGFFKRCR